MAKKPNPFMDRMKMMAAAKDKGGAKGASKSAPKKAMMMGKKGKK